MLAIEAGGIAALIVGVVAVARSSAFGRLRKITDVIAPHGEAHHRDAPHTTPADLNGRHPGPDLGQAAQPAAVPPPAAIHPSRMRRPPYHGPASGEEGG